MGDFISDLWGSVFTPGATPTLLLATNATFAMLQLVLAMLLAATYSIHFVVLSILCGGLWWAINWFATELQQAQAKEEEAERIRKSRQSEGGSPSEGDWKTSGELADSADDEGTGTETEGEGMKLSKMGGDFGLSKGDEQIRQGVLESLKASGAASAAGSGLVPPGGESRRRTAGSDMSGDTSTDSEWEKVDGER